MLLQRHLGNCFRFLLGTKCSGSGQLLLPVFQKTFFPETPQWLEGFYGRFTDWTGLSLQPEENLSLRKRILSKTPSLLDVRNYLFARQCLLLLQINKPWEVSIYLKEVYIQFLRLQVYFKS